MWFCKKKKKVKCERCGKLFFNVQYHTDDKICLKCFDKIMRELQKRSITSDTPYI